MRAYRYQEPRSGFSRLPGAAALTTLLGGGALVSGRWGSDLACGEACMTIAPLASLAQGVVPMTSESVSWGLAGVIGAGLALLIALLSDPRRKLMAALSVLALAVFGMLLFEGELSRTSSLGTVPEAASGLIGGVAETLSEPAESLPLPCPEGSFSDGEGCRSCTVTENANALPSLRFEPVRFAAAWGYAEDDELSIYDDLDLERLVAPTPLRSLAFDGQTALGSASLCSADAALVLGSASSDGPRARNEARAWRRAERLSQHVAQLCPGLPIYAASLGQSNAARDVAADRAITVLGIEGDEVTPDTIERELSRILADGGHRVPLLSRSDAFGGRAVWVKGGEGTMTLGPRVREPVRTTRLTEGAPASCHAPS